MRKLLFLIFSLTLWAWCMAAPVRFAPTTVVQPNGDTLHCFVSGDEFYHWLHDSEGFTIVQNPHTRQYVYAGQSTDTDPMVDPLQVGVIPEGLCATTLLPGRDDPAKAGLRPNLMPTKRYLRSRLDAWKVPEDSLSVAPKTSGANHGILNNIVIFIRFADEDTCTSSSFSTIDSMFNDSTAGNESLFNYFHYTSYGNLRVVTHYLPTPSADFVLSYQDMHVRNYFKPYNAVTNPIGYTNDTSRRNREFTLLQNAVSWINANCAVSSLPNLDMDNDGKVDNICFIVSGTFTAWNDLLWPHKWSLYDRTVTLGNKRIWTYNLQLAGSGSHYFSVSTLCHEMTHTLGAPDLYHYDSYTNVSPGGAWDLMNSNQTPPQQTNSFFKYHYLNWIDSIPLIEDSGEYTLQSLASGPNNAVKIAAAAPHQWYILEYRNNADTFDASIPNQGLLIWRYNDRSTADNANFNFYSIPHQLWLFRPNSNIDTVNGTIAQAALGISSRHAFHIGTNPYPYLCDGTPDSSFRITNIHLSGTNNSSVTFTFNPNGNPACGTVHTFPLEQGFEEGDNGCWTTESISTENLQELGVTGTENSIYPHSGNYQFRFSSFYTASDYNQYLISPCLQHTRPLQMSFWYRRSHNSTENFKIQYSTTNNAVESFTNTIADIAVSTNDWQQSVVTIPAEARYVAINYYSNYKYHLFVDDITIYDTLGSDTIIRDTVYISVHDTLDHIVYDTLIHWIHDTLTHSYHDTLYTTVYDTLFFSLIDTVEQTVLDTTFFQPSTYEVAVLPNEITRGNTSGSGFFLKGTRLEIAALAYPGYHFSHWMDGNTNNPRTITVNSDILFNAYFAKGSDCRSKSLILIHDTIVLRDTVWRTIHQTVNITLHDTLWVSHIDTITVTTRDTLWMPRDEHDTFYIVIHEQYYYDTTSYYQLAVRSANPTMGAAAGNGIFPKGTVVQLGALPNEGYHFVQWSDGATDNPHSITITGNATITATFAQGRPESIDNPIPAFFTKVYTLGQCIVTESPANLPVTIYNIMGQLLLQRGSLQSTETLRTETQPLRPGLYIVRIGTLPATKVIIP